jgi:hypothetical protein
VDRGDDFFGCGVDDFESLSVDTLNPLVVDEPEETVLVLTMKNIACKVFTDVGKLRGSEVLTIR